MSSVAPNTAEETQLLQTIEMFEVIVQSQPNDCQSLEILKEAYTKLGREADIIRTSKRIAEAYTQMGQLSSAILEYETVLQRRPNDEDVQTALRRIEDTANNASSQSVAEPAALAPLPESGTKFKRKAPVPEGEIDDGQKTMRKIYVDGKLISATDFDICWRPAHLNGSPQDVAEPFIHTLGDKGIFHVEKSLRLLTDKSRTGYVPLERYDVDMELLRGFPADVCRRWCVAPFDRMSKSVLVATANPFNQQAAKELSEATTMRLLWYLVMPSELLTLIRKAFR
ncbi:MAG: hypothetical protein ACLQSR_07990 [Limisphaerales bacterium]